MGPVLVEPAPTPEEAEQLPCCPILVLVPKRLRREGAQGLLPLPQLPVLSLQAGQESLGCVLGLQEGPGAAGAQPAEPCLAFRAGGDAHLACGAWFEHLLEP